MTDEENKEIEGEKSRIYSKEAVADRGLDDEFISTMDRTVQWAKEHAALLVVGISLCAIALIAVVAWGWWKDSKAQEATTLYYEASQVLERDIDESLVKADDDGNKPKATLASVDPEAKAFPSEAARALAGAKKLETLLSKHSGTKLADSVMLKYAGLLWQGGEYQKAADAFGQAAKNERAPLLKGLALEGQGLALEAIAEQTLDNAQKNQHLEKALAVFVAMETHDKARSLYHQGRVLEQLRRYAEAKEKYDASEAAAPKPQVDPMLVQFGIATEKPTVPELEMRQGIFRKPQAGE